MKICALLAAVFLLQDPPDRTKAWSEDLYAMSGGIAEKHPNAFLKISIKDFNEAVDELRKRLPDLKDHQVLVEFMKIAALIGDAHTGVSPQRNSTIQLRPLPIGLIWLKNGLFIARTPAGNQDLLKARITAIGGVPIDEAAKRVGVVAASDNVSGAKQASAYWLTVPEVLAGVGIIEGLDKIPFTIVDAQGVERIAEVTMPEKAGPGVLGFDMAMEKLPVSRQVHRNKYGKAAMQGTRTLYAWYDSCADDGSYKVSDWCRHILEDIDELRPDRIVLDLRRNGGGNSALLFPLITGLRRRPDFTARGKLFVLVDRPTFSSGLMNALSLRAEFKAILVGSPPGGSPNHFGEVKTFTLPHSSWMVRHSTRFFQLSPGDRDTVRPDLEVEMTSAEFFAGEDPVLEAAIEWKKPD